MKTKVIPVLVLVLLFPDFSCRKIKDYFRDPDTEQLIETLHTTTMIGHAVNLAMAMVQGNSFSFATFSRSNNGFPCTTLMVVDLLSDPDMGTGNGKADAITIAGLWPDENTAILSVIITDFHAGDAILDVLGIKTIPVIRDAEHTRIALANMDIQLNPDQESFLQIDLNSLEIESKLLRLQTPPPTDVYVAVLEDAYFIDINNNETGSLISDDSYTITGGGQLIEVTGSSAEIVQQALVEVLISPECNANPTGGMALTKVTGLADKGFPELGTAVLEFTEACRGTAYVYAATGQYVGSHGKHVSFNL